ncbi:MAG: hypothetical protein KGP12_05370 [Actinomycetales bacterium]|nr:hypothetical protein [Actinomycetales bacterium]
MLACGITSAGVGIALLLRSGFGITPVDAVVAGISSRTGVSVGTALIAVCAILVVASWRLGQTPGIGTLISFVCIGVCVDAALHLVDAFGAGITLAPWQARACLWLVGACLLALAASCLYASGLGASPYDLFVQSAGRFGLSIPVARLLMDAVMLLIAWLIGGAWGVGTVGLLVILPFLIRALLPRAERFATHGRMEAVSSRPVARPADR